MDVELVDFRNELRQSVEFGFYRAPIVRRFPVLCERASRRQLHALRRIGHGFALGPSCCADAIAQLERSSSGTLTLNRRMGAASLPFGCTVVFMGYLSQDVSEACAGIIY